jgi:hypothetical protein
MPLFTATDEKKSSYKSNKAVRMVSHASSEWNFADYAIELTASTSMHSSLLNSFYPFKV